MTLAFEALAEPTRRTIVEALRDGERAVGELVDVLGVSQPSVSKHLRVLRDAGLVASRVDAQRRLYRVRPEPLRELDEWLAPFRTQWSGRLDLLEAHLDRMSEDPDDDHADHPVARIPATRQRRRST